MKRPNKAARSGGGGRGGKGARSEGWQTAGGAPDAEPDQAHRAHRLPADRRCGAISVPAGHARPPARARCGKAACRDLCGGQGEIPVPTATAWWKGDTQLHLVVSKEKFAALPNAYQAALRSAAALADDSVRAQYDAANPGALKRLVVGGAQLRLFSQEVLEVCFQTTNDLYAQLSLQNARFMRSPTPI